MIKLELNDLLVQIMYVSNQSDNDDNVSDESNGQCSLTTIRTHYLLVSIQIHFFAINNTVTK